jgi:endonuclease/exonuclease/phosphatase family metal-dependent hydrolase
VSRVPFCLLTWNAWHGLSGQGVIEFGELEPKARREQRWLEIQDFLTAQQVAIKTSLGPLAIQVVALQEVNPLLPRRRGLESALRRRSGGAEFWLGHSFDQRGLKLRGFGWPRNLETGLITVVTGAERVTEETLVLSGPRSVSQEMSLQLHEARRAHLVLFHDALARPWAVANLHLHHGFEPHRGLLEHLERALFDGRLEASELEFAIGVFEEARARRRAEMQVILKRLDELRREQPSIVQVIMGDFNSPPDGEVMTSLIADGWTDLGADQGPTWDPERNPLNHERNNLFRYPYPDFNRPQDLQRLWREYDRKPRRIDAIFLRGGPHTVANASAKLITGERVPPSDHFGVQAWGEI